MDFGSMLGQCWILFTVLSIMWASFFEHRLFIVFELFFNDCLFIVFELIVNDCLDLAENFLLKPNSSKNTSHDSSKAGGVTPWREEMVYQYKYIA